MIAVLKDHITGLAHIGYVVENLQRSVDEYKKIYGVADTSISIIPPYGEEALTRFAFISVNGVEFELIEPVSEEFKTLLFAMPSGGGGINHVAYVVDDIEACLRLLLSQGIGPGHVTPDGIIDLGAKKMLYLNPDDTGGMVIELIEIKHE